MNDRFEEAYREHMARRSGKKQPAGEWDSAGAYDGCRRGTFTPDPDELQPCCQGMTNIHEHMRSAKHVGTLFGLDPEVFSTYVRMRHVEETKRRRSARWAQEASY